jgi:hypothetical protein
VVRAAGDTGLELIELQIDQAPVATFALSTSFEDYAYVHHVPIALERVRVAFVNDGYNPPLDLNATIDWLALDGTLHQTEDPAVFSVGAWDDASLCGPGFKQLQTLSCDGYFQFAAAAPPPPSPGAGAAAVASSGAPPQGQTTSQADSQAALLLPTPQAVDALFSQIRRQRWLRRRGL